MPRSHHLASNPGKAPTPVQTLASLAGPPPAYCRFPAYSGQTRPMTAGDPPLLTQRECPEIDRFSASGRRLDALASLAHGAAWLSLIWPVIAALVRFVRLSGQLQVRKRRERIPALAASGVRCPA